MNALFQGFDARFRAAYGTAPDNFTKYVQFVPSGTTSNIYPFLEQFGGMREWLGDRQVKNISSKKIQVFNRDFEDTVSVKRNDIEDDQYGIYGDLIAEMGLSGGKLWQEIAIEALVANENWVDNVAFFAASGRSYGDSAIVNAAASALSSEAFEAAYTAMSSYKGHNGKSLGARPDTLFVGPSNRKTAWDILENQFSYDSTDKVQVANANRGLCTHVVLDELSGDYAAYWFLACTKGIVKPVAAQKRREPKLTRLDRDEDYNVFMKKEFIYGTDARGEAFKTFPHLIYRGGASLSMKADLSNSLGGGEASSNADSVSGTIKGTPSQSGKKKG